MPPGDLAVIIPARNEADRIAATVTAAATLDGADIIVVVDDGSTDGTAAAAAAAGARVVRHPRNRGKAAAMETGAQAVQLIEAAGPGPGPGHVTCCSSMPTWPIARRMRARLPSRFGPGRRI